MSKIAICALPGVYHEVDNKPCQDAVGKYKNGKYSSVVLCDGAGSVKNSEIASTLVTERFPKYLCDNFEKLYCYDYEMFVATLADYFEVLSKNSNVSLDCTLLAIVTCGDRDLIIHVGDGVIISEIENEYKVLSYPENGEESNITYFLSSDNLKSHIRMHKTNANAYLLTSDGISNLLYDSTEIKKAVSIMFGWLKTADEQITENKMQNEFERIFKQYTLDDISVALLNKEGQ